MSSKWLLLSALVTSLVSAQDGVRHILSCKEQSCNDCPGGFDVAEGFPDCTTYDLRHFNDFNYPTDGLGYDVWWNIPQQEGNCRVLVRSPAAVDLPGCGTAILSQANAGCYYTFIERSWMVQFCCGDGDCDAAETFSSMGEARVAALQGTTSSVYLGIKEPNGEMDFGDAGSLSWKQRDAPSGSTMATDAVKRGRVSKRDCDTYTENDRVTKPGTTVEVTPAQVCNSPDGCSIDVSVSVTEGRTISAGLSATFFEVISLSIGVEFTMEEERSFTTSYNVPGGARGRVVFTSTLECTIGTASGCDEDDIEVEACTPRLLTNGNPDGTFFFRYE